MTVYADSHVTLHHGDALTVLRTLPAESVQTCIPAGEPRPHPRARGGGEGMSEVVCGICGGGLLFVAKNRRHWLNRHGWLRFQCFACRRTWDEVPGHEDYADHVSHIAVSGIPDTQKGESK